jgi:hypothetical protein
MVAGRSLFEFKAFYYSRETYKQVLTSVDFQKIQWPPMALDEEGIEASDAEYWQETLSGPPSE